MADQTPPHAPRAHASLEGAFASLRGLGLRRNPDDRWLAGVCSGIADRLQIDPLVVRGVLLVLLFVGGIGGLAYLVAWALLPDRDGRILAEDALHGHAWGIVLLVAIGLVVVSDAADRWWLWLVLVPVGLLCWWAVSSTRAGKTPEQMGEDVRAFTDRVAGSFAAPPAQSVGATSATPRQPASTPPNMAYASQPARPHGLGPGRSGAVAPPPRVVHRSRRRGGLLALLLLVGLAVAGHGAGSLLWTEHAWRGSQELVGAAFALGGAGLALILVGLVGRRAGFSVLLVTLFAAADVLATTLPSLPGGGFGQRSWSAASAPAGGFSLTAGEARLSLSGAVPGQPVRVELGAGEVTVRVPPGVVADVSSTVHLGQLTVQRTGGTQEWQSPAATGDSPTQVSVGSGTTHVPLEVRVGAGQITIVEES